MRACSHLRPFKMSPNFHDLVLLCLQLLNDVSLSFRPSSDVFGGKSLQGRDEKTRRKAQPTLKRRFLFICDIVFDAPPIPSASQVHFHSALGNKLWASKIRLFPWFARSRNQKFVSKTSFENWPLKSTTVISWTKQLQARL